MLFGKDIVGFANSSDDPAAPRITADMTLRVPSSLQSNALHLVRRTTQEVQFDTGFLTAVVEGFSHAGYLLVPGTHSEERCVCSFITCSALAVLASATFRVPTFSACGKMGK